MKWPIPQGIDKDTFDSFLDEVRHYSLCADEDGLREVGGGVIS